jgi:hypothetical protein
MADHTSLAFSILELAFHPTDSVKEEHKSDVNIQQEQVQNRDSMVDAAVEMQEVQIPVLCRKES